MTQNQEYVDAVDASGFPGDPGVPLDDRFTDERGYILNVLLTPSLSSVARIWSLRGSVRANHYHKTDWHYAVVESGRVLYFERPVGSTEIPEPRAFTTGQMFFTPPDREHAMLFTEDTVIYTFAKNIRDHETHEADLVRVSFVTPEVAAKYMASE